MKAATRLQAIREDWTGKRKDLDEALTYNRKLWTILVTSATEADNPLPPAIKQNIANIGLFVFNRTITVMAEPAPEKLVALVNINREIAAGLRAMPASPEAA
jgi:flagellar protein FlaF